MCLQLSSPCAPLFAMVQPSRWTRCVCAAILFQSQVKVKSKLWALRVLRAAHTWYVNTKHVSNNKYWPRLVRYILLFCQRRHTVSNFCCLHTIYVIENLCSLLMILWLSFYLSFSHVRLVTMSSGVEQKTEKNPKLNKLKAHKLITYYAFWVSSDVIRNVRSHVVWSQCNRILDVIKVTQIYPGRSSLFSSDFESQFTITSCTHQN